MSMSKSFGIFRFDYSRDQVFPFQPEAKNTVISVPKCGFFKTKSI